MSVRSVDRCAIRTHTKSKIRNSYNLPKNNEYNLYLKILICFSPDSLGGFLLNSTPHYLLVESNVLPEVFLKVIEAKQLLLTGQAHSVNEAARIAGLSRSAYYKYKDSVHPFNQQTGGYIITLNAMLRDEVGVLSKLTSLLYCEGANIMTINQNIPVRGIAPVTVTARADGIRLPLSDLLDRIRELEGVNSIEVISGV